MRWLIVVGGVSFAACSNPASPMTMDAGATSCTTSTCDDAVGSWSFGTLADAGASCGALSDYSPLVVSRSGGALCIAGTVPLSHPAKTTLSSDGGCGLTLKLDEGFVDAAVTTVRTYQLQASGSSLSGVVELKRQGDGVGGCMGPAEARR
ncbi:MAG: hypothetical protein JNK82_41155 [Myxococcaceae bacterium]|nr:hypothetical protein [Myxococcaceae bacterium]